MITKPIILVYGWYHQKNLGDDLFAEAFRFLFPEFEFIFVNKIKLSDLNGISAVFFGGGSFLDQAPQITSEALSVIKNINIFYIGVGIETNINPIHLELISKAKLVATRSPNHMVKLNNINNVIYIPDLVYSLQDSVVIDSKKPKSILYLPNSFIIPKNKDPLWKYNLWEYFKSEFSQALDHLIKLNYSVDIFPMCHNKNGNDNWAGIEVLNKLNNVSQCNIIENDGYDISSISKIFSKYETIISSRFHGIILSNMVNRKCLTIKHHDKLNYGANIINYNLMNKDAIIDLFFSLKENYNSINIKDFNLLTQTVNELI